MRKKNILYNTLTNIITYIIIGLIGFIKIQLVINIFGSEINGYQSFLTQYFKYLILLESGFGIALGFSLYKPFSQQDTKKINALINASKIFFRIVGILILILGIIAYQFIPFFIGETSINESFQFALYFLMLLNVSIPYFFIYNSYLLDANQKQYKKNIILSSGKIVHNIVTIVIIIYTHNLILAFTIELLINLICLIILKIRVSKEYEWLDSKVKADFNVYRKIKFIIPHSIAGVLIFQTDNLVAAKLIGLNLVSIYSSYMYIITFLRTLISSATRATQATFGNIFALKENDAYEKFNIFKEITFLLSIFTSVILIISINPFMKIWLGDTYRLDMLTVYLLGMTYFHMINKDVLHIIRDSNGLYKESIHITILEGLFNLLLSIILGIKFGLIGIILGTFVSFYFIDLPLSARLIYKVVFDKNYFIYIKYYATQILTLIIMLILNNYIINTFNFYNNNHFYVWFFTTLCLSLFNIVLLIVLKVMIDNNYRIFIKKKYKKIMEEFYNGSKN